MFCEEWCTLGLVDHRVVLYVVVFERWCYLVGYVGARVLCADERWVVVVGDPAVDLVEVVRCWADEWFCEFADADVVVVVVEVEVGVAYFAFDVDALVVVVEKAVGECFDALLLGHYQYLIRFCVACSRALCSTCLLRVRCPASALSGVMTRCLMYVSSWKGSSLCWSYMSARLLA